MTERRGGYHGRGHTDLWGLVTGDILPQFWLLIGKLEANYPLNGRKLSHRWVSQLGSCTFLVSTLTQDLRVLQGLSSNLIFLTACRVLTGGLEDVNLTKILIVIIRTVGEKELLNSCFQLWRSHFCWQPMASKSYLKHRNNNKTLV